MANAEPYIYLYKKIMETAFYRDSYAVHIAIHLLLKANYRDTKTVFNGQEVIIHRGEHLTGRHVLAEETGIKQSTVRNKLTLLQKIGFLDIKSNNRFSIISICKYSEYQESKKHIGQHFGQPEDNQRTTKGQQKDTPNKDNELKELKKETKTNAAPGSSFPEKKEKPKTSTGSQTQESVFAELKSFYPKKNGKFLEEQEVFRRFCLVPEDDWSLLIQAVKNYANSERVKDGVGIKDPKNFIGNQMNESSYWKEWIEPEKTEDETDGEERTDELRRICENVKGA